MSFIYFPKIIYSHIYYSLCYRYCFLAFGYDERVVSNRENCRLLLVRLKMDGWAIGKTKVFLKYYHIEYLAKLYEDQVSNIFRNITKIKSYMP